MLSWKLLQEMAEWYPQCYIFPNFCNGKDFHLQKKLCVCLGVIKTVAPAFCVIMKGGIRLQVEEEGTSTKKIHPECSGEKIQVFYVDISKEEDTSLLILKP